MNKKEEHKEYSIMLSFSDKNLFDLFNLLIPLGLNNEGLKKCLSTSRSELDLHQLDGLSEEDRISSLLKIKEEILKKIDSKIGNEESKEIKSTIEAWKNSFIKIEHNTEKNYSYYKSVKNLHEISDCKKDESDLIIELLKYKYKMTANEQSKNDTEESN